MAVIARLIYNRLPFKHIVILQCVSYCKNRGDLKWLV